VELVSFRDELWQGVVEFVGYVRDRGDVTASLLADEGFELLIEPLLVGANEHPAFAGPKSAVVRSLIATVEELRQENDELAHDLSTMMDTRNLLRGGLAQFACLCDDDGGCEVGVKLSHCRFANARKLCS
jgi:hypothetical protein